MLQVQWFVAVREAYISGIWNYYSSVMSKLMFIVGDCKFYDASR